MRSQATPAAGQFFPAAVHGGHGPHFLCEALLAVGRGQGRAMRALLQRVTEASVRVDGALVGAIGQGFLVLLGVAPSDTEADAAWLADRVAGLRVFADETGKMNLSLLDTHRAALVVSQFTLYADTQKGRRPSFAKAAPPEQAERLYLAFCLELEKQGVTVARGVFGAHMEVALLNDGPVTLLLDSERSPPA